MANCKRCGQCCRLGGPVLHREDLAFLSFSAPETPGTERVPDLADLVTVRKGELARDDVAGTLLPLDEECVKIAPAVGSQDWACRFLLDTPEQRGTAPSTAGCAVYAHRPAQCRALDCTDTQAIANLYAQNRATREEVLRAVDAPEEWIALIPAHEETCAFSRVAPLARLVLPPLNPGSPAELEATDALLETLRYDISFRSLCVERGNIPATILPFLLGRPLAETLGTFGLALNRTSQGLSLVRKGRGVYGGLALFD